MKEESVGAQIPALLGLLQQFRVDAAAGALPGGHQRDQPPQKPRVQPRREE